MFGFLLTLLIIDALVLSVAVLMQAGQGGGLASMGGGGTTQVLGGRGAQTLLTRLTWWTGGIFMALSLLLTAVHSRGAAGGAASEVQRQLQQQALPQAPLPVAPIEGTGPAPADPGAGTPQPQ